MHLSERTGVDGALAPDAKGEEFPAPGEFGRQREQALAVLDRGV